MSVNNNTQHLVPNKSVQVSNQIFADAETAAALTLPGFDLNVTAMHLKTFVSHIHAVYGQYLPFPEGFSNDMDLPLIDFRSHFRLWVTDNFGLPVFFTVAYANFHLVRFIAYKFGNANTVNKMRLADKENMRYHSMVSRAIRSGVDGFRRKDPIVLFNKREARLLIESFATGTPIALNPYIDFFVDGLESDFATHVRAHYGDTWFFKWSRDDKRDRASGIIANTTITRLIELSRVFEFNAVLYQIDGHVRKLDPCVGFKLRKPFASGDMATINFFFHSHTADISSCPMWSPSNGDDLECCSESSYDTSPSMPELEECVTPDQSSVELRDFVNKESVLAEFSAPEPKALEVARLLALPRKYNVFRDILDLPQDSHKSIRDSDTYRSFIESLPF
jgi:hypothetical protein